VWHRLGTLGPAQIFSAPFWRAPLYGDAPLGLAFSENQLYPALLLWPVRAATGEGRCALDTGAVVSAPAAIAHTGSAWRADRLGAAPRLSPQPHRRSDPPSRSCDGRASRRPPLDGGRSGSARAPAAARPPVPRRAGGRRCESPRGPATRAALDRAGSRRRPGRA